MIRHKDYLLPEVAEGARNINLNTPGRLAYQVGTNWSYIKLPPGTWQLIGLGSELTEEQCDCIVGGPALEHEGNRLYQPWTNEIEGHYSASENLSDLLRSHNLNATQTVILKLIQP